MTKMSGLGRGIGSLIPNKRVVDEIVSTEYRDILVDDTNKIFQIPVDQIDANPQQPRQVFDHAELEELINSIREYGIVQPLVVTRQGSRYELIAGERRLRSAKILGLPTVPCIVRDASEQEKLELAIIENVQRQNLNPLEEAVAYERLINQFNLTQDDVALKIGKARSSVANTLRILTLPEAVQKALVDGKITEGHARVIAGLNSEVAQIDFLNNIVQYNFNVRDAERESRKLRPARGRVTLHFDPAMESLKEDLRSALSTKVDITKKGGKGQIIINYFSEEELRNIIKKIVS